MFAFVKIGGALFNLDKVVAVVPGPQAEVVLSDGNRVAVKSISPEELQSLADQFPAVHAFRSAKKTSEPTAT